MLNHTGTELKRPLLQIVKSADEAILSVYKTPFQVQHKSDASPVTEADRRAHDVICEGLTQLDPTIPIVSEESAVPSLLERSKWEYYWLVDPLDGTKEFVKRSGEFTVNIALIYKNQPHIGVASIPVSGTAYYGDVPSLCAFRVDRKDEFPIQVRELPFDRSIVMQSKRRKTREGERFLKELKRHVGKLRIESCGSSLKCLRIAEGAADLYLQAGATSEWDTGATHAILKAAGGNIFSHEGNSLRYNERETVINPPFFALGDLSDTNQEMFHTLFNQQFH